MPEAATFNLNDEQNHRFAALAAKTYKSVSDLIHQALEEFLDRNIPRPKSAAQIGAERDAVIIQTICDVAKKHGAETTHVRKEFSSLNTKQLMERYDFPIEVVKEIQSYVKRTQ